jgi:hypothetical protein
MMDLEDLIAKALVSYKSFWCQFQTEYIAIIVNRGRQGLINHPLAYRALAKCERETNYARQGKEDYA